MIKYSAYFIILISFLFSCKQERKYTVRRVYKRLVCYTIHSEDSSAWNQWVEHKDTLYSSFPLTYNDAKELVEAQKELPGNSKAEIVSWSEALAHKKP